MFPDKTAIRPVGSGARGDGGAAMIIVLTIIFVMTTLGGIALLATLGNLRMSAKYTDWTAEYYELDTAAEDRLRALDRLLAQAEGYAYAYMRDGHYRVEDGAPIVTGNGATELNEKAQDFIYSSWYNGVYSQSLITPGGGATDSATGGSDTAALAAADGANTAAVTGLASSAAVTSAADVASDTAPHAAVASGTAPPAGGVTAGAGLIDDARYNSLFLRFNEEFFQRLYYYYAYRLLTGGAYNIELSREMAGFAGMLEGYGADPAGMKVAIDVSDGAPEYAKHINLGVYVTSPVFGYETQNEDVPFKANPIWTGALTARGSVRFTGAGTRAGTRADTRSGAQAAHVYGDVSAADYNEYYPAQNGYASPEGNEFGVVSAAGTDVEIYGNVYTRGDLHVTDGDGSITVNRYPEGFGTEYRVGAFGNTLFFDPSNVPAPIQRFTQPDGGDWTREFLPFFYRDHYGGNVYCNSLAIEEGADGASITVNNAPAVYGGVAGAGVVWTLDDVQNDGVNSRISIAGNLIGLSSDAAFGDHTSSSAVVNTHFDTSRIELAGGIIMPGAAFMKFDGVNDMNEEETYYQTAGSVTATNPRILRAYMEKPVSEPESLYYYDRYLLNTERGPASIFLVHYDAIADTARHVAGVLAGDVPDSGIVTGVEVEGYAGGLIIARAAGDNVIFGAPRQNGGLDGAGGYREIKNYSQNYVAYSEIQDSLYTAFKSKTESLGTAGYLFGDLVKPDAVLDPAGQPYPEPAEALTYLLGDSAVELDGEQSGIIYCAAGGDSEIPRLTLRGDGVFRGTIISEGDIIVEGSPTIYYDEDLVAKIILYYPEIRDFFSPGEMGDTNFVRVVRVAQAAKKLKAERYRVAEWAQRQD